MRWGVEHDWSKEITVYGTLLGPPHPPTTSETLSLGGFKLEQLLGNSVRLIQAARLCRQNSRYAHGTDLHFLPDLAGALSLRVQLADPVAV